MARQQNTESGYGSFSQPPTDLTKSKYLVNTLGKKYPISACLLTLGCCVIVPVGIIMIVQAAQNEDLPISEDLALLIGVLFLFSACVSYLLIACCAGYCAAKKLHANMGTDGQQLLMEGVGKVVNAGVPAEAMGDGDAKESSFVF